MVDMISSLHGRKPFGDGPIVHLLQEPDGLCHSLWSQSERSSYKRDKATGLVVNPSVEEGGLVCIEVAPACLVSPFSKSDGGILFDDLVEAIGVANAAAKVARNKPRRSMTTFTIVATAGFHVFWGCVELDPSR